MAENPATWGQAERIVARVLNAHEENEARPPDERVIGLSVVRQVTDALREAGLLISSPLPAALMSCPCGRGDYSMCADCWWRTGISMPGSTARCAAARGSPGAGFPNRAACALMRRGGGAPAGAVRADTPWRAGINPWRTCAGTLE